MNDVQKWNRKWPPGTPVIHHRLDKTETLTETTGLAYHCPHTDRPCVMVAMDGLPGGEGFVQLSQLEPQPGGLWSPKPKESDVAQAK